MCYTIIKLQWAVTGLTCRQPVFRADSAYVLTRRSRFCCRNIFACVFRSCFESPCKTRGPEEDWLAEPPTLDTPQALVETSAHVFFSGPWPIVLGAGKGPQ